MKTFEVRIGDEAVSWDGEDDGRFDAFYGMPDTPMLGPLLAGCGATNIVRRHLLPEELAVLNADRAVQMWDRAVELASLRPAEYAAQVKVVTRDAPPRRRGSSGE